ncbi:MAG: FAD-dependent oxidoreductase [Devosia sp.]
MRGQPNRLAAETAGPFSGSAIDRSKPLQFRLDGRTINGFVGDTVLSAVLAAGIDTVGTRANGPMALSTRFAPAIIAVALARDQQRTLAMERTLATAGAEYLTLASGKHRTLPGGLRRLFSRGNTLGLDLQQRAAMRLPWMEMTGAVESPADLIVVGGGVAGMSAAVAAAKTGLRVILLEASPHLGGCARLFGTLDGEETADASLERLHAAIAGHDAITALTHASVFAARPGTVRVHITDKADDMPSARVVDLQARHIVIATGTSERLPLFAGNRLPGTVGVREAHDLAEHYGVWPGQSALIATASSAAYRLAMMVSDAGIRVPRIIDARPQPQSRFIEFCKAYGMTLAAGTIIADTRNAPQGRGLLVTPQLSLDGFSRREPALTADRLVTCGGWQADLDLWHMAGGASQWNDAAQRLEAGYGPEGVALAGNAAGYRGHHACLASGQAAIDQLLGRPQTPVCERSVDEIYETPDAPAPIAPPGERGGAPSFLDAGRGYVERPQPAPSRRPVWWPFADEQQNWSLADAPQALGAADIASAVQLGFIPPDSAGLVAQERVAMVAIADGAGDSADRLAPALTPLVPSFLAGRFGANAQVWLIEPGEARRLESGALIQPNSDTTDPRAAIGVVLGQTSSGCIALIDAGYVASDQTAAVRDHGRATLVRLIGVYDQEQSLAGTLG